MMSLLQNGKIYMWFKRGEETNRKGKIEERRGLANNQINILEDSDYLEKKK